jgi:histidyl-tRNA synthetase
VARITPLSGFPEWLPGERIVEQHVVDTVRSVFELHGFASIETRSVEPLDQLLRKGETDKEIYVLRRLQADPDESESGPGSRDLGLHFDLTVPFARYVLENAGKLDFPFRRYQIQKAWRGERPQEGRYREFLQADIDVVGKDTLPFHYEVEAPLVIADALSRLRI